MGAVFVRLQALQREVANLEEGAESGVGGGAVVVHIGEHVRHHHRGGVDLLLPHAKSQVDCSRFDGFIIRMWRAVEATPEPEVAQEAHTLGGILLWTCLRRGKALDSQGD